MLIRLSERDQEKERIPMRHFANILVHIFAATLLALFVGAGIHFHGSVVGGVVLAAAISFATLFVGFSSLFGARRVFGLMQLGIALQCLVFFLVAMLAVTLSGLIVSAVTVTSAALTAATILGSFVLLAWMTGQIKTWKGRAWLPVRMPRNFR
jgi:hypothetical protein